jgi:hypothetical protein
MNWNEVLRDPGRGDHIVQAYRDTGFLVDAVTEYLGTGLQRGEGAIVIARTAHTERFLARLPGAAAPGQLLVLDAQQTLDRFMADGMPQWQPFHESVGGAIAEMRLQFPAVRAYGEMVDILWQAGNREAAIRLEEYWNELERLQTFSLFCAYAVDPLDPGSYSGLHSICKAHTHFFAARDGDAMDEAVHQASRKVLDEPFANLLLALAAKHHAPSRMTLGQAALFWLAQNMPRAADKVLKEIKASSAAR